jgi:hypothetical protein
MTSTPHLATMTKRTPGSTGSLDNASGRRELPSPVTGPSPRAIALVKSSASCTGPGHAAKHSGSSQSRSRSLPDTGCGSAGPRVHRAPAGASEPGLAATGWPGADRSHTDKTRCSQAQASLAGAWSGCPKSHHTARAPGGRKLPHRVASESTTRKPRPPSADSPPCTSRGMPGPPPSQTTSRAPCRHKQ